MTRMATSTIHNMSLCTVVSMKSFGHITLQLIHFNCKWVPVPPDL